MTEPQQEPAAVPESNAVAPPPPASSRYRAAALALAAALVLVVALVATVPFWAPFVPWGPPPDRAEQALAARLDQLAAAGQQNRQQAQREAAVTDAALQRLERRLAALEARPAASSADLADIREQIAKLSNATVDLATRVAAIDKAVQAQAARDTSDMAVALVLLQIRNAVAAGRPFAAEYETLVGLARRRPEIAQAAAPLAEPAKAGVASRAVLAKALQGVAESSATAKATPPASGWTGDILARLRGIVTIRPIDGGAKGGPQATVSEAERALADGDLKGAVAALDKLSGAPAEAAAPWLRMARERLAVETALQRIETLLTERLGNSAAASGPRG